MAQASYGRYDQLSVASAEVFREYIDDNVFGSNLVAQLGWEQAEEVDPGRFLALPLLTAQNQTAMAFGQYDDLDSSPQQLFSAAVFPWSWYTVAVTLDYQTLRINRGPNTRINTLAAQVQTAIASLMSTIGNDLCSLTKAAAGPTGQPAFGILEASDDGQSVNTYGNISRTGAGSLAAWQGNVIRKLTSGGIGNPTNDAPPSLFYALYNATTWGASVPNYVYTSKQGVAAYMFALQAQQRLSPGDIANVGFAGANLFAARMVADDHIVNPVNGSNVGCNYIAINTEHAKFYYFGEKGLDFVPWVQNSNVAAKTARYMTVFQYASSQPRTSGQLLNVNAVTNL